MKIHLTLSFVLACACSTFSFAQIRFAPKVGMNISSVKLTGTNSDVFTIKSKVGFSAGVAADVTVSKLLSIQPSLLYSQHGFKSTAFDVTQTGTTNYLELPVVLSFNYPINEKFKVIAQAGPYIAYCLNAKAEVAGESTNVLIGDTPDSDVRELDYGINGSIGVEAYNFQLLGTYGYGLSNNQPSFKPRSTQDTKYYNRNIGITLAYFFTEKKD